MTPDYDSRVLIINSRDPNSCAICKKAFVEFDTVFLCRPLKQLTCYDCEHDPEGKTCIKATKEGHNHWKMELKIEKGG